MPATRAFLVLECRRHLVVVNTRPAARHGHEHPQAAGRLLALEQTLARLSDRLAGKPFPSEHWFVRSNGQIDKVPY